MIYSNQERVAFALNSGGFTVLDLDLNGNIKPDPFGDEMNSVLMHGAGKKDDTHTDIYEGDVVFFCRRTVKGWLPVIGVVNSQDFTFCVNAGLARYTFDYADKNIYVLGNIFETSDEELAAKAKEKLDKYTPEALKKISEEKSEKVLTSSPSSE